MRLCVHPTHDYLNICEKKEYFEQKIFGKI
jgi:predicted nucleotidyltransferase